MNIQLGVICADMVDFHRLGHKYGQLFNISADYRSRVNAIHSMTMDLCDKRHCGAE